MCWNLECKGGAPQQLATAWISQSARRGPGVRAVGRGPTVQGSALTAVDDAYAMSNCWVDPRERQGRI